MLSLCCSRGRSFSRTEILDRRLKLLEAAPLGAALPIGELDRLELAKAKRRGRPVDGRWNEPTAVPSCRSLVADPCGFDRLCRPENNDRVGRLQRLFNDFGELRASPDVEVPPYRVARLFERQSNGPRLFAVVAVVA